MYQDKSSSFQLASVRARFVAFIVDLFMVYTPLLYFFAYFIVGSIEEFKENQVYPLICFVLFLLILNVLLLKKSQTPGYKYANLYIVSVKNKEKPSFLLLLIRYLIFCISYAFIFGLIFVFFRKDRVSFHDLVTNTRVLQKYGE